MSIQQLVFGGTVELFPAILYDFLLCGVGGGVVFLLLQVRRRLILPLVVVICSVYAEHGVALCADRHRLVHEGVGAGLLFRAPIYVLPFAILLTVLLYQKLSDRIHSILVILLLVYDWVAVLIVGDMVSETAYFSSIRSIYQILFITISYLLPVLVLSLGRQSIRCIGQFGIFYSIAFFFMGVRLFSDQYESISARGEGLPIFAMVAFVLLHSAPLCLTPVAAPFLAHGDPLLAGQDPASAPSRRPTLPQTDGR